MIHYAAGYKNNLEKPPPSKNITHGVSLSLLAPEAVPSENLGLFIFSENSENNPKLALINRILKSYICIKIRFQ
jgi:hypothetical protein